MGANGRWSHRALPGLRFWPLHTLGFLVLGVAFVARTAVARRYIRVRVVGQSMVPTLWPGDVVLAERVAGRASTVRRGDVVILSTPAAWRDGHDLPDTLIKRIVAVPGEACRTDGATSGVVVDPLAGGEHARVLRVVPRGFLAVEGDSNCSLDSRSLGLVEATAVEGVVIRRITYVSDEEGEPSRERRRA